MALEPTRFDDLVFNRIAYKYGAHLHLPHSDDFNEDRTAFSYVGFGDNGVHHHVLIPIVDCLPLLVANISGYGSSCIVDRYGWYYENDYYDGPNAAGEKVPYRVLIREGYAAELDARNHEGTPEQMATCQPPDSRTVRVEKLSQMYPEELEELLKSFQGRIKDLTTLLPQLIEAKVRVEMVVQERAVYQQ